VLLVTPDIPLATPGVFAAFDAGGPASPASPGPTRISSVHLAGELLGGGLRASDLVARAGVLATANDLANAAASVVPELAGFRRALLRTLGRPVGLSGSGPTLWALYASESDAATAAEVVRNALVEGDLVAPGNGPPFVAATTFAIGRAVDATDPNQPAQAEPKELRRP
jgi:4-diphosphocytidyl-2C-methyl-D-erythritol kinase